MRKRYFTLVLLLFLLSAQTLLSIELRAQEKLPFTLPSESQSELSPEHLNLGLEVKSKPQTPLSEIARDKIKISAKLVSAPKGKSSCVLLQLENNSDRAIKAEGPKSKILLNSKAVDALPLSKLEKALSAADNPNKHLQSSLENTVTAAVSIGALQALDGERRLHGPVEARYGFDNERRSLRLAQFGTRVLFPGDNSKGTICFPVGTPLSAAILQVQISSFYNPKDELLLKTEIEKN